MRVFTQKVPIPMKTLMKLLCAGIAATLLPATLAFAQDIKERAR